MSEKKSDNKRSALRSISGNASSLLNLKSKRKNKNKNKNNKKALQRVQRSLTSGGRSQEDYNTNRATINNDLKNSFRSNSITGSRSELYLNDNYSDFEYSLTPNKGPSLFDEEMIQNFDSNNSESFEKDTEERKNFVAQKRGTVLGNKDNSYKKTHLTLPDIKKLDTKVLQGNENANIDPLSLRLGKSGSKTNLDILHSKDNSLRSNHSNNSNQGRDKIELNENESGIFSSIISVAHNAASHLMHKSSLKNTDVHDDLEEDATENSKILDTDSQPASPSVRNSGFLNHLNFILSSTNDEDSFLNKTTTLSSIHLDNSLRNSSFQFNGSSTGENEHEGEDDMSLLDATSVLTTLDNVKFRSVKNDTEPPISTFGKGDLTLEAVDRFNSTFSSTPKIITPPTIFEPGSDSLPLATKNHSEHFSKSTSLLSLPRASSTHGMEIRPASPEPVRSRSKKRKNTESTIDSNFRSFSPNNTTTKILPFRHSFTAKTNQAFSNIADEINSNNLSRTSTSDIPSQRERQNIPDLQAIEYASAKKNAEFHSIFHDTTVSPVERLIADFSCALSKDILIQGKLFISDKHLCFYSNILGWVKSIIVPFKEIVQIEQKNTAMFFRNAIALQTLHEKFLFTSFISRDSAFELIMSVWNQIILDKHIQTNGKVTNFDGNDGSSAYGSDYAADTYGEIRNDFDSNHTDDYYVDDEDDDINFDDMTSSSEAGSVYENENGVTSEREKRNKSHLEKMTSIDSIATLGASKHEPTSPSYEPRSNEKILGEAIFNAPLGKIINLLYGSNTTFIQRILKAQGNHDISPLHELLRSKRRDMIFTKSIHGNLGPIKTKCEVTEAMEHFDLDNYVQVLQVFKTPDLPQRNTFAVKIVHIFSWTENNSTKLKVYAYIEGTSKNWNKSTVEKGSLDDIESNTKLLIEELYKILHDLKGKTSIVKNNTVIAPTSNLPKYGPQEHQSTSNTFDKTSGYEIVEENINLKIPVGTTFQLLCGDDRTYLKRILERQKNFDISEIPKFESKTRKYEYTKPLNGPLGPKQTRCLIREVIETDDVENCIVLEQISKTPDVPSGNSFEVHTKFYLSWGENNSTNMLVATKVEWSGKSWIKSAVEKGSINGQKSGVQDMVAELKDIISASIIKKKPNWVTKRKPVAQRVKRKLIHEQNIPKPAETESQWEKILKSKFFETILANKFISTLLIIFMLLTTLLFSSLFKNNEDTARFVGQDTIIIHGQKYHVVPSLDNSHTRSEHMNKMVLSSEFDIWNWINDRQGIFKSTNTKDKVTAHKKQELDEIIRLTEMKLEQLKNKVEEIS